VNTPLSSSEELDAILWQFATYMKRSMGGRQVGGEQLDHDQAKAKLQAIISQEAKAYGGCRLCYGKGYATVVEYASGYDTDQDIGSPGGKVHFRQPSIRYCRCGRGKQLEAVVSQARIEELKRAYPELMKHSGLHGEGNYYFDDRIAELEADLTKGGDTGGLETPGEPAK
jgi:hypothetical protein